MAKQSAGSNKRQRGERRISGSISNRYQRQQKIGIIESVMAKAKMA